jgi:hypothetical protein
MFTPWNAKPIPLGQRLFHRGKAYSSGVGPEDSTVALCPMPFHHSPFTFHLFTMLFALCPLRHVYPASPASPVGPADRTGVAPADGTGVGPAGRTGAPCSMPFNH